MSLRKPVALSLVAHLLLAGAIWFLPRNADLTEKMESLPMEIFENLKDQSPMKQLSQNIKRKLFKSKETQPNEASNPESKIQEAVPRPAAVNEAQSLSETTIANNLSSVSSSLVDGAQVTIRAKLLSDHKVTYPEEAKENSIEGPVIMDLVIDSHGKVVDAKLVKGPGYGLDEAALAASSKFVFSPARIGDKPVSVRIRYTYRFVLDTR